MFSLARGGYAPAILGRLTPAALPCPRSSLRPPVSASRSPCRSVFPGSAYVYLFGISLFGGLFAWSMIFVTHLASGPNGNRLAARVFPSA